MRSDRPASTCHASEPRTRAYRLPTRTRVGRRGRNDVTRTPMRNLPAWVCGPRAGPSKSFRRRATRNVAFESTRRTETLRSGRVRRDPEQKQGANHPGFGSVSKIKTFWSFSKPRRSSAILDRGTTAVSGADCPTKQA